MKLLELFKISRKKVDAYKAEGFSDFFRNAPEEEKKKDKKKKEEEEKKKSLTEEDVKKILDERLKDREGLLKAMRENISDVQKTEIEKASIEGALTKRFGGAQ